MLSVRSPSGAVMQMITASHRQSPSVFHVSLFPATPITDHDRGQGPTDQALDALVRAHPGPQRVPAGGAADEERADVVGQA